MFTLKTERWGEVEVRFEHLNVDKMPTCLTPGTRCFIINKTSLEVDFHLAYGLSKLVPPDQYCKARGRKIALKLALANLEATRDERKLFWEAYFEAMKPKPEILYSTQAGKIWSNEYEEEDNDK